MSHMFFVKLSINIWMRKIYVWFVYFIIIFSGVIGYKIEVFCVLMDKVKTLRIIHGFWCLIRINFRLINIKYNESSIACCNRYMKWQCIFVFSTIFFWMTQHTFNITVWHIWMQFRALTYSYTAQLSLLIFCFKHVHA